MPSPYKFCGACLRAAREAAGLTREQLAARIDRSDSLIALWELEYRPPPVAKLIELGAVLGVPVEEFFEDATAVHA